MSQIRYTLAIALIFFAVFSSTAKAETSVFHGVLFVKSNCEECEIVRRRFLPGLKKAYKEKIQILSIDNSDRKGSDLYMNALIELNIPISDDLPLFIIGNQYYSGLESITDAESVIRDIAESGGNTWPDLTGLKELLEHVEALPASDKSYWFISENSRNVLFTINAFKRKYNNDRVANQYGVVVLICLIFGLFFSVYYVTQKKVLLFPPVYGWLILLFAIAGILVTLQLADVSQLVKNRGFTDPGGQVLALLVLALMTVNLITHFWRHISASEQSNLLWLKWGPLLLFFIGFIAATYLWAHELGGSEAVCGAVGNCNAVQQSEYARILGFFPVALAGIFGNILFLGAWLGYYFGPDKYRLYMGIFQWIILLLGVLVFSYLTFLEPFVIGETCFWCLTGAIAMVTQLIMTTQIGVKSLDQLRNP